MDFTWVTPVIAGVARNITGWLDNALNDGKIEGYEWGQLASTVLTTVVLAVATKFGLGTDWVQSSAIAILGHYGITTIRSVNNK